MSKCPYTAVKNLLRPGLPDLTARLKRLSIDERGYPVPWFVAWIDGKPEFRMADAEKRVRAVREDLCWVCGGKLGSGRNTRRAFVAGPMCGINRTSAEPPSHCDCAEWSVIGCPFLSKPQMVRREDEVTAAGIDPAGLAIKRNPGVTMIWNVSPRGYETFADGMGGWLIRIGEPESVTWWCEGRIATRAEVDRSIETGLPNLLAVCDGDEDRAALAEARERFNRYLP